MKGKRHYKWIYICHPFPYHSAELHNEGLLLRFQTLSSFLLRQPLLVVLAATTGVRHYGSCILKPNTT